jgi:hypothetical protein
MELTDVLVAAMDDAERLAGANDHVTEDRLINELVEFACNGRHTPAFDAVIGGAIEPRVRVLPATPSLPARYPHEPRPAKDGRKGCDRCSLTFLKSAKASASSRRDGKQHVLWIAAGTAVVEVVMCTDCHASLSASFDAIVWR